MKKRNIVILLLFAISLVGCGSRNDLKKNYIENSKKASFVDIAMTYINSVSNEVNMGYELSFFSTDTLYLVPIGDIYYKFGGSSCVIVESGGKSPYSDNWKYAYVGVIYNGEGYQYFFVAEDESGHGISFMTSKELVDNGHKHIYASKDDENYSSVVKDSKIAMNANLHDALVKAYKDKENHFTDNGYTISGAEDMLSLTGRRYIRIYGKCNN